MKGTIAITAGPEAADAAARQADKRNEIVIFKNCVPFTDCISKMNNTRVDNAKDLDVVITDSKSFKSEVRITRSTPDAGNTKDVEITVPLKYLSNFHRTLEMSLINCEIFYFYCNWGNKICNNR